MWLGSCKKMSFLCSRLSDFNSNTSLTVGADLNHKHFICIELWIFIRPVYGVIVDLFRENELRVTRKTLG